MSSTNLSRQSVSDDLAAMASAAQRQGSKRTLKDLNLAEDVDPDAFLAENQPSRSRSPPSKARSQASASFKQSPARVPKRSAPSQLEEYSAMSQEDVIPKIRSRSPGSQPDRSRLPVPMEEPEEPEEPRFKSPSNVRRSLSPEFQQASQQASSRSSTSSRSSASQRLSAAQKVSLPPSRSSSASQSQSMQAQAQGQGAYLRARAPARQSVSPRYSNMGEMFEEPSVPSPRTPSSRPSYSRPSGRLSRSSRSPYREVSQPSIKDDPVRKEFMVMSNLRNYINSFNDQYSPVIKELFPKQDDPDMVDQLLDPNNAYIADIRGHFIVFPYDAVFNDMDLLQEFSELVFPAGVRQRVTAIELLDLLWVINWFKSKAKSSGENARMIRKVYNSSDRALKRKFGTDDRVACVVEYLTDVKATEYLQNKGRVGTALNNFMPTGLYLFHKFGQNFEQKLMVEDSPLILITAPSLDIKERATELRRLFLNADPSQMESVDALLSRFNLRDLRRAREMAAGSIEDKIDLLNALIDTAAAE